jgi:hypothetical protein
VAACSTPRNRPVGDSVRHESRSPPRSILSLLRLPRYHCGTISTVKSHLTRRGIHRTTSQQNAMPCIAALSAVSRWSRGSVPALTSLAAAAHTGLPPLHAENSSRTLTEAFSGQFKPLPRTLRRWVRICRLTQMNNGVGHGFQRYHSNSQTHPCPLFRHDRYIPDAASGGRARNCGPPHSCTRITDARHARRTRVSVEDESRDRAAT